MRSEVVSIPRTVRRAYLALKNSEASAHRSSETPFSEAGPFCLSAVAFTGSEGVPHTCQVPKQLQIPLLGGVVPGVFTPVLAKHSKSFSLIDCISVGVDRMQRNFEPMREQVEAWQKSDLTDVTAKVVIYEHSLKANWRLRNTLPAPCTICTSSRSTRNSDRERSGVSPTRSPRHSRNSTLFLNLRPRQSWASSW